jgi:spore germination protein GerM
MTPRRAATAAVAILAIAGAWLLFVALPRWYAARTPAEAAAPAPSPPPSAGRKINATLYYVSEDGMSLVGMQREVPFADALVEQARQIVLAQLGRPPAPLASAIPEGTALRTLYLSEKGDVFVDLSSDVRTKHPGGALEELFTVYSIVDAVTVNLPSVTRVQILVEGQEVDTLAGHVDVRHPLQKNLKWVKAAEAAEGQ